MNNFTQFIKNFIEDESGLTAVEYAIAGGLVVGGMVGAFLTLGDNATVHKLMNWVVRPQVEHILVPLLQVMVEHQMMLLMILQLQILLVLLINLAPFI